MKLTHKTVKVFNIVEPADGAFERMLDSVEAGLFALKEIRERHIHLTYAEDAPRYVLYRAGLEAVAESEHAPEAMRNIAKYILRNTTVDDDKVTIETNTERS